MYWSFPASFCQFLFVFYFLVYSCSFVFSRFPFSTRFTSVFLRFYFHLCSTRTATVQAYNRRNNISWQIVIFLNCHELYTATQYLLRWNFNVRSWGIRFMTFPHPHFYWRATSTVRVREWGEKWTQRSSSSFLLFLSVFTARFLATTLLIYNFFFTATFLFSPNASRLVHSVGLERGVVLGVGEGLGLCRDMGVSMKEGLKIESERWRGC